MNMTCLEYLHQEKGHDKADRSPLEASQSQVEHPGQTVAQAGTTLKAEVRWIGEGGAAVAAYVSELD